MSVEQTLIYDRKIHPKIVNALIKKGITDEELIQVLFSPTVENLIPPRGLPGMDAALKEILKYTGKPGQILIWGHDDVDGVSSVAIMMETLKLLEATPLYYIPRKDEDGHRLNRRGVDYAADKGVKLIITVDTGMGSVEEVEYARRKGIDVIITDHHEIPEQIPDTLVINPKMGGGYPYLSGSGVAFKVAWGLLGTKMGYSISDIIREYPQLLVFAALGILADKVPVFAENKAIVDMGRELLNRFSFVFAKAYQNITGQEATLDNLIPVLASGETYGQRHESVELLITDDEIVAEELVKKLVEKSEKWSREVNSILNRVLRDIRRVRKYILVDLRDVDPRYIGYIASRVRDRFKVPVIVISRTKDGMVIGEIRMPYGFNALDLLESVSYLLEDYGGHKQAAGFTMDERNLSEFVDELEFYFSESEAQENLEDYFDIVIDERSLEDKLFHDLDQLRKLGVNFKILYEGRLGELQSRLFNIPVIDPQQMLSLYSADTMVKVIMETMEEGFRIEEVIAL